MSPDKACDPPPKCSCQDDTSAQTADVRPLGQKKFDQSRLLDLPDELLLRIASSVDGRREDSTKTDHAEIKILDTNGSNSDDTDAANSNAVNSDAHVSVAGNPDQSVANTYVVDSDAADPNGLDMPHFVVHHTECTNDEPHAILSPELRDHVMLRRSQTLVNFIYTCKRLAPIGREALITDSIVSWGRLHVFIDFLLRYPTLIEKLTSIHTRYKGRREERESATTYDPSDVALIGRLIYTRLTEHGVLDMSIVSEQQCSLFDSLGRRNDIMFILLALCPNLHEVDMDCRSYALDFLSSERSMRTTWQVESQLQLLDQITSLNITSYDSWRNMSKPIDPNHGLGSHMLFALDRLKNLRELSMPQRSWRDFFSQRHLRFGKAQAILPELQTLTVYMHVPGDVDTLQDVHALHDRFAHEFCYSMFSLTMMRSYGFALALTSIRLCILHKYRDSLYQLWKGGRLVSISLDYWTRLNNEGIEIQTYFLRTPFNDPTKLDRCIDLRFRLQSIYDKIQWLQPPRDVSRRDLWKFTCEAIALIELEHKGWHEEPQGAEIKWQEAQHADPK